MVNGIRASDPHGLNKGCGSNLGSRVRQETPGVGRRIYRAKRCEYKNEDSCPKTWNDRLFWLTVLNTNDLYTIINFDESKVDDLSWGWPEGSLFNSYYTKM